MKLLKFVLLKEFNEDILLRYVICDRSSPSMPKWSGWNSSSWRNYKKKDITMRYVICDRLWTHQCQNEVADIRPPEGIQKDNKMRYVTFQDIFILFFCLLSALLYTHIKKSIIEGLFLFPLPTIFFFFFGATTLNSLSSEPDASEQFFDWCLFSLTNFCVAFLLLLKLLQSEDSEECKVKSGLVDG